MNAKKTPLQQVNEEHGGKAKLVDKLVGLLESDDKDSLKQRLLSASNQKLLHLLQVSEKVKSKYGSPEKLTEAVAGALGRAKDSDYVKKLSGYSPAKLLDIAGSLARRAGTAAKDVQAKTTAKAKEVATKAKGAAAKAKGAAKEVASKAKAAAKKK
jgi:hypothetical protein